MSTMTLYTRGEAADRSLTQHTNVPGTCQLTVREWIGALSAGDFDGDGAADAEDGWKSEPEEYRHLDRKPPRGCPVSWLGGSHDYGHRALSLGHNAAGTYFVRMTDGAGMGRVGTVPLGWVEANWGLTYAGWSETMDGMLIPTAYTHDPEADPAEPSPHEHKPDPTRGDHVDAALAELREAKGKGARRKDIEAAIDALRQIKRL